MSAPKIVLVSGARTPIGSFGGALSGVDAYELGAVAVSEALRRAGVAKDDVDEVVMGCIAQNGPDAYNARRVALAAGLPTRVPAFTVNRLCGSGLQAIWSAAQELRWGGIDVAVAGATRACRARPSSSTARGATPASATGPARRHARDPHRPVQRPAHGNDGRGRGIPILRLPRRTGRFRRRESAESCDGCRARGLLGRDRARDHRWPEAVEVSVDEHPRPGTTLEALAGLRPAFEKDGSVTAGNSSGINDGAQRRC